MRRICAHPAGADGGTDPQAVSISAPLIASSRSRGPSRPDRGYIDAALLAVTALLEKYRRSATRRRQAHPRDGAGRPWEAPNATTDGIYCCGFVLL